MRKFIIAPSKMLISDFLSSDYRVIILNIMNNEGIEYIANEISLLIKIEKTEIRDLNRESALSLNTFTGAYNGHTDGVLEYRVPEYVALEFIKIDDEGYGENLFWPLNEVIDKLTNYDIRILQSTPVIYRNPQLPPNPKNHPVKIINRETKPTSLIWRWDDFCRPFPLQESREFDLAINRLRTAIQEISPISVACQAGDVMLIKNQYVLHGRSPLSSRQTERHVRRAWIFAASNF
jgi:hypothetical protein